MGHNSDRGCGDDLGLRSPEDSLTHSLTRLLTDGGSRWDLSTYKQPLYVAWASSQHGDWLPRVGITRQSGRGSIAIYDPAGKSCNMTSTPSSFCWGSHKVLPQFKGKGIDFTSWREVARSWKSVWGQKYCCGHLWKWQSATTRIKCLLYKKKIRGTKEAAEEQLTNHTWSLSMPAPISLPLGNFAMCAYCKLNGNKAC